MRMKKLKEKYAYRKLKHRLASAQRIVKIPRLEAAQKVGVLWKPDQLEAFIYLHHYFSQSKVIFRNLCIYSSGVPSVAKSSNAVTTKDLNWIGLPKTTIIDGFINTEFDLLLNLALDQNLVLDYITALSRAKFKVGCSKEKTNYFDLNINISSKQDALYLAKQQIFYIGELNKTKQNG